MTPATSANSACLVLDCTFGSLSLGLRLPDGEVLSLASSAPRAPDALHASLLELCERTGRPAHAVLAELVQVAVTTGPGSFTGIRLGLAVAAALQLAHPGLYVVGLPTLALLARQFVATHAPQQSFHVLLDAAGQQVYTQHVNAQAQPLGPAQVLALPEAAHLNGPLYHQASLLLPAMPPAGSAIFTHLDPALMLAAAEDSSLHLPATPQDLKPLTYKPQAQPQEQPGA